MRRPLAAARRRPVPGWRTHRSSTGRALAALLAGSLTALAMLAGCGVPTQDSPQAIPPSLVQGHLGNSPAQSTTTTTAPAYSQQVTVYFTRTGTYIAPVSRLVRAPVTIKAVLKVLVTTGPSPVDTGNGYQSAFARTVHLLGASVVGSVATVDFNKAFGLISGNLGALAVAQVVYTVTSNDASVKEVAFQIEGQAKDVPSATGASVAGPVTATQYESLTHPPASTTTTAPAG